MSYRVTNTVDNTTTEYRAFKPALDHPTKPAVIRWDDRKDKCCLDIDDIVGFDPSILISVIEPAPSYAWVSRSGRGIHAIYDALEPFAADELAALGVLWCKSRSICAGDFELLKHTFTPPGDYISRDGTFDSSELDKLTGRNTPDESVTRDDWLQSQGMTVGARYPHDRCPIAPSNEGKRDPVIVYDNGIYCHFCKQFRSFQRLQGRTIATDFGLCVRNRTHWEHAKFIVGKSLCVKESLAEAIYSAALTYAHNCRQPGVFFPRRNMIRLGRWWATETGELYNDKIGRILGSLPAVRYIDDKGKEKIDGVKLDRLSQTTDLTELGYPSIEPIRGMRIWGHYLPSDTYSIVVNSDPAIQPKYAPEPRDIEGAWKILEQILPGINRPYIELLIAARGCSEGQIGLPPFLYVCGPSSTSKTASIMVAASIIGDNSDTIPWKADIERNRQAILRAKARGSFVAFDEICKAAKREGVDIAVAMDDVLTLTPNSLSHEMYIGPVPLGRLPVIIWADTDIPDEIRNSVQFGRRLIFVHLTQKVDWERSTVDAGLYRLTDLRKLSFETNAACDVIASDLIDRFFQHPQDLKTIAAKLGFRPIIEHQDAGNSDTLVEFFRAVCSAPPLPEKYKKRWPGDGWKLIDLHETESNLLAQLWDALRDSGDSKTSRRLSEADWAKLVGTHYELEITSHGSKIAVRFNKVA